jgi:hypothetical protein
MVPTVTSLFNHLQGCALRGCMCVVELSTGLQWGRGWALVLLCSCIPLIVALHYMVKRVQTLNPEPKACGPLQLL